MNIFRHDCGNTRILQITHIAERSYQLRLIAGGRYLTPKLPITFKDLLFLESLIPFSAGDVHVRRQGFDIVVDFMGEHWATIGAHQWGVFSDKIVDVDQQPLTYEEWQDLDQEIARRIRELPSPAPRSSSART